MFSTVFAEIMSLLPIFCAYRIIMSAYFWCEDFSRVRTFNGLTLRAPSWVPS